MRILQHLTIAAAIAALTGLGAAPAAEANPGKGQKSTTTVGTPYLAFDADRLSLQPGETALLSWATANVGRCMASGGWSGRKKESGSERTVALLADTSFTLSCATDAGTIEQTVVITVAQVEQPLPEDTTTTGESTGETTTTGETTGSTGTVDGSGTTTGSTSTTESSTAPTTEPTTETTTETAVTPPAEPITPKLQLQASATTVKSGESVTLNWTGEAVSNCQASGSWTGSRPTSGSETRNALTASESYTLACDSANGQIMAMTSVQVMVGGTEISWTPPEQNIDGTPLAGLSAYRIYLGSASQQYDQHIELQDAATTQYYVDLLPGEYYIAMTAVDVYGNESPFSNEIHKVVQ